MGSIKYFVKGKMEEEGYIKEFLYSTGRYIKAHPLEAILTTILLTSAICSIALAQASPYRLQ